MNHNAAARFTEVESALYNHGVPIGWYSGVAAGKCVAVQLYDGIIQDAASEVVVFVEQSFCFCVNECPLFLDLFLE